MTYSNSSRQTLVLDSTQINDYLTCDQYWKLRHHEQLTLNNVVTSKTAAGSYGHHILEYYYKKRANGMGPKDAMEGAIREIVLPKDYPLKEELRVTVIKRCLDYWMTYSAHDVVPLWGNDKHKVEIVNGSLTDKYVKEPLVEQGFSYELLNDSNHLFVLEGRIDLMFQLDNFIGFMDHKFQERERNLYTDSIQFKNYALAMDLSFGIINYIRLHKEVNTNTYKRQMMWFNTFKRLSWKQELIGYFKRIAIAMDKGDFPKNPSACPGKYGYICDFTKICEEKSLVTIEAMKKTHYMKKEEWKPW